MGARTAGDGVRREQLVAAAHRVARRDGIDGVTLRAVAAEAEVSHGLLVFYFGGKEGLVSALLDRVLATTTLVHRADELAAHPPPSRLALTLRQEALRLVDAPEDLRLFLEYWALAARRPAIREKIGHALDRYRVAFAALATSMPPAQDGAPSPVTPDVLAAIAVSLVTGCAVQAAGHPGAFDLEGYVDAAQLLFTRLTDASG